MAASSMGFSIILRDPPISSSLRGATEDGDIYMAEGLLISGLKFLSSSAYLFVDLKEESAYNACMSRNRNLIQAGTVSLNCKEGFRKFSKTRILFSSEYYKDNTMLIASRLPTCDQNSKILKS